jgi:hypothetical protein
MISFQARSGRPFADDHTATKVSPLAELNWWNDRGGSQRLAQLVNERRRMQMDVSRFGGPVQRRDFEAKRRGSPLPRLELALPQCMECRIKIGLETAPSVARAGFGLLSSRRKQQRRALSALRLSSAPGI